LSHVLPERKGRPTFSFIRAPFEAVLSYLNDPEHWLLSE
jgi:hypothetical protein